MRTASLFAEYDLFLDESGLFLETSTDPSELAQATQAARHFPSQLAGLLVRRDRLREGDARQLQRGILGRVGMPTWPHARDVASGATFDAWVLLTTAELAGQGIQPVRLVNRERVRYGDRVATYTNLLAELVVRICQQKHHEGEPRLSLRLYPANLKLREEANGTIVLLDRGEYLRRLQEYLAFAAVRRGLAADSAWWRLDDLYLRPGNDPRVGLCDLISNASHDDFVKCGADARAALEAALGVYDVRLAFLDLVERVERDLAQGSLSQALIALAEGKVRGDASDELREATNRLSGEVVSRLKAMPSSARDVHLQGVVG